MDLGFAVEAIPSRVASDFVDFAANSICLIFICHDHKEFVNLVSIQDEGVGVEVSVAHDHFV